MNRFTSSRKAAVKGPRSPICLLGGNERHDRGPSSQNADQAPGGRRRDAVWDSF